MALLVAQELSNRQIASALTLSEHTVATHIPKRAKEAWAGFQKPGRFLKSTNQCRKSTVLFLAQMG